MPASIATFLMFDGKAEEAIQSYLAAFPEAQAGETEYFEGPAGKVKRASFVLKGQHFMCFDSPTPHAFGFTPSISLFVECTDTKEFERVFKTLSADGEILMPPGDYGFSSKFTWFNDRFGVSWQLNVA